MTWSSDPKPGTGFELQRVAFLSLLLFFLTVSCAFGRERLLPQPGQSQRATHDALPSRPRPASNVAPANLTAASSTPYFSEIPGAIPDQTPIYTEFVTQIFAHVATLDISHDGLDDMVFHMWKTVPLGTNPASAVPCTNRLVILIQQPDHTFVDQTSTWMHGAPDLGACSADLRVDDVNADGYPDVVFATSQEDGRDTNDWSKIYSPISMLVSGADAKYTREQIGTPGWYHMVGTGRDGNGKVFVAIAAFVSQAGGGNLSEFHQRNPDGTWTNVSAAYPKINPGSFSFFNAAGQSSPSDTLILQAIQGSTNPLDIGGATRDVGGVWHTVPNLNLFSIVGNINFITWAGYHVTYPVFRFGDLDVTGGGWLESCQFRMSPGAPAMTIMKLSETAIPGGYTGPDQIVNESDLIKLTHLYGFQIVNGVLQQASLPISGEVTEAMEARFFACRDLNGDGYDDIAVYSLAQYPKGDSGLPYVYLNDKNGGLHYIGLSPYPAQPDDIPNQPDWWNSNGRTSVLHDFDHDGIDDLLTWPGAGVQAGGGRDLSYHYYKGVAHLQVPIGPPSLSIAKVTVTEGDAGTKLATFTATLSDSVGDVSFDIATGDGTAFAGSDYVSKTVIGQLIPSGQTSATFAVIINGDTEVESNETFTVNVSNVTGATVLNSQALGTISNDDSATLSIADASLVEGNSGISTATFALTLSQPMPTPIRFDITTNDGTANVNSDYHGHSQSGRIFDAGRTRQVFEVIVNGDTAVELDETFVVTISNVAGAALADGIAIGTIVNDDAAAVVAAEPAASAATTTVAPAAPLASISTPIDQIQGAGAVSAWHGKGVLTEGAVTALTRGGFFLETPDAQRDADQATSEGIFVSSSDTAVRVGDLLRVTGQVQEAQVDGNPDQLTLTQIAAGKVLVLSSGNALPRAVLLDLAHPGTGPAIAILERLEGMRVAAPPLRVVGPVEGIIDARTQASRSNGRFYVVAQGVARPFIESGQSVLDRSVGRAGVNPARFDDNPERVLVNSAGQRGAPALSADVGDTIAGMVGVLGYGQGTYQVLPDTDPAPVIVSGAAPKALSVTPFARATIGSFNLRRFFDATTSANEPAPAADAYATRLAKTANVICAYARNPDILALQGVENQSALSDLALAVNAKDGNVLFPASCVGDSAYRAYLPPGRDQRGMQPGFLISSATVRPGVPRVEVLSVTRAAATHSFRHRDGGSEALSERPPLILQARINDADGRSLRVTVIDAHLAALASDLDSPDSHGWAMRDDYLRARRAAQSAWLAELIQARQRRDPGENLVVLGDFEASEFNDGHADLMGVLSGRLAARKGVLDFQSSPVSPPLTNLTMGMPVDQRYTVVREGNAQAVDHMLVNSALLRSSPDAHVEVARINADFGEDNLDDPTVPMRVSDHDPIVGYFELR